ncbi:MAG: dimethyl sulfoxide reductase anchor subunit [Burkholderiales bacterium]|nr:dimethyl sulfoxide reductase anchor subunit [Burkholderiales bacterium]
MNPAWSVVFLTTLIGAGQGLVLALFAAELAGYGADDAARGFLVQGAAVAVVLAAAGLAASFFHLGRPERAWRSAAMWRTSWLSREVIALPAFIAATAAWAAALLWAPDIAVLIGLVAALAALALYLCTAMVYASLRFLQEWASPLTVANFALLGLASGATLASALAAAGAPSLRRGLVTAALVLTTLGAVSRALSLWRNARLVPRSTLQSAIGIRHPRIRQIAQGFTGGSFNTREFFHGASPGRLRGVKWFFLAVAFALPLALLALALPAPAFVVQFGGLLAERWFFLAQARHPQNLYYQAVS